jgi:hypothetical protein
MNTLLATSGAPIPEPLAMVNVALPHTVQRQERWYMLPDHPMVSLRPLFLMARSGLTNVVGELPTLQGLHLPRHNTLYSEGIGQRANAFIGLSTHIKILGSSNHWLGCTASRTMLLSLA